MASLARPGGNITGNTVLSPDLSGKRLQILREAIASVSCVAYLANSDNASTITTLAEMRLAAASAGMTVIGVEVGSGTDFDDAFTAMLRAHPDALLVSNDPLHQLHIDWIITFLAQHRLPGMFYAKENVAAGGLMAYGASVPTCFGVAPAMCTASCKAPIPLTCQSSCRRSSISPST